MAHVTIHGGIKGNLGRLIPDGLCAEIDLNQVQPLPIFSFIKSAGNFPESKMLTTFNCGVGMCIVVSKESAKEVMGFVGAQFDCYEIGKIRKGSARVAFKGTIRW